MRLGTIPLYEYRCDINGNTVMVGGFGTANEALMEGSKAVACGAANVQIGYMDLFGTGDMVWENIDKVAGYIKKVTSLKGKHDTN